jgi:peptide/nickel transport system substrate-binding protein
MENRFGVKDFFLFTLLAVLIGVVALGMVQFDRQWDDVQKLDHHVGDQSKELAGVSRGMADISRSTNSKQTETLLKTLQKQLDEQNDKLTAMQKQSADDAAQIAALKSQSAQLAAIQKQLNEGLKVAPIAMPPAPVETAPAVVTATPGNAGHPPGIPPAVEPTTAPAVAIAPAPTTAPTVTVNTGPDDPFTRIKAAQTMPGYAQGDWLVDSGPNSDKITPMVSGDSFAATVQSYVLESLVQRDPVTLEFVPLLAKPGWTVIDNVAAYKAYRAAQYAAGVKPEDFLKDPNRPIPITIKFRLRPGVVFSDGEPMTVDDIVWTFNFVMNPAIEAPRARAYLSRIRKVTKTGDDEVTFDFDQPYFDPLSVAGEMSILPEHWYAKFSPDEFNRSTGYLMGSGPYKMPDPMAWKSGQDVTLYRNDRYWGEAPAFDRLVFRIFTSALPKLTAFTNGELDYFSATPDQYKSLKANQDVVGRTNHFEYDTPTAGYRFIAWNQRRDGKPTRFADKRVRQAMTLLTDRQGICDEIMLGLSTPATGPFNRLGKQNDPSIKPWPYDVDQAKALLKAAGYVDNGSGQLVDAAGNPFEFKFTYPSGSPTYDRIVLYLKDAYARAGITMEPDRLDWSVFSARLKAHDFEVISLGWTAGLETDLYQIFDTDNIKDQGDNFCSYSNPKLDKLIEEARETVDEKKRMDLWHQCHVILHDDQPYTFLFTSKVLVFVSNRIKNVQRVPNGLNDRVEWFVPTDQQKWHP